MYLRKGTSRYKDTLHEYAQIVKSVRREDGKSSGEVVKRIGRIKTRSM
jgi:hypothetical protein